MSFPKFIAIEGLDGAGKSTQIALLIKFFEQHNCKTKFIHFPRSGVGVYGELIAKFLRGEFGNVGDVHPQLVALLFARDRIDFAPQMLQWIDDGYYVLVDRYVLSNIAYQCAKLKDETEKNILRDWILNYEFQLYKIPQPELSIYLDVPFTFTQTSLSTKRTGNERDYLQGKEDIHESDFSFQASVKKEYDIITQSYPNIASITCYDDENKMLSVEEIHTQIIERIRRIDF
ncbi:MAG TPA: dTMP kinase [Bacteroidia bacterium]|nr:dTMP kinase [Bacteroidia bacterium]